MLRHKSTHCARPRIFQCYENVCLHTTSNNATLTHTGRKFSEKQGYQCGLNPICTFIKNRADWHNCKNNLLLLFFCGVKSRKKLFVGMAPSAIRVEGPEASTRSRCSLSNNCRHFKVQGAGRDGTGIRILFALEGKKLGQVGHPARWELDG
jgi:hypothetical protein